MRAWKHCAVLALRVLFLAIWLFLLRHIRQNARLLCRSSSKYFSLSCLCVHIFKKKTTLQGFAEHTLRPARRMSSGNRFPENYQTLTPIVKVPLTDTFNLPLSQQGFLVFFYSFDLD